MFTMTSAETLGMIAIYLLIGIPAVTLLMMWAAFRWPGNESRVVYESGSLGAPAAFREPAEPSYVDKLITVQGRSFVIHKPDPVELYGDEPSPYSIPLAELVASARRYMAPTPTNAPVSPARHLSPTIDTSRRASTTVGKHRALPELVAA